MTATVVPLPRRAYRLPAGTLPETPRRPVSDRIPLTEAQRQITAYQMACATAQGMRQPSKWRGRGRAMGRLLAWIVVLGASWGFVLFMAHLLGAF